MKKNTFKQLRKHFALVVAAILCISMMNISVFAAEETTPETNPVVEEYSDGGVISYNTQTSSF